jgi:hypothetical protein
MTVIRVSQSPEARWKVKRTWRVWVGDCREAILSGRRTPCRPCWSEKRRNPGFLLYAQEGTLSRPLP